MPIPSVPFINARRNTRFVALCLSLFGAALFLFLLCSPALAAKRSDFSGYAEGTFLRIWRDKAVPGAIVRFEALKNGFGPGVLYQEGAAGDGVKMRDEDSWRNYCDFTIPLEASGDLGFFAITTDAKSGIKHVSNLVVLRVVPAGSPQRLIFKSAFGFIDGFDDAFTSIGDLGSAHFCENTDGYDFYVYGVYPKVGTFKITNAASGTRYSSSDPNVAFVSGDGQLFTRYPGTTRITATNGGTSGSATVTVVAAEQFAEESNMQFLTEDQLKARQQAEYEKRFVDQEEEKRKAKEKKKDERQGNGLLLLLIAIAAAAYALPRIPDSWIGGNGRLRDSLAVAVALTLVLAAWLMLIADMSPTSEIKDAENFILPWPFPLLCFASVIAAPLLQRRTVGLMKDERQIFRFFLGYFFGLNILFSIFGSPFTLGLLALLAGAAFSASGWLIDGASLMSLAVLLLANAIATYYFYRAVLTWGDDD